jgi:uncharacterized cofD-like protein
MQAIKEADLIVFGPGSLYTSIIPNLLVDGIAESVAASSALKVYVCNIMTQEGETEGYTVSDHIKELFAHSIDGLFQICMANSAPVPEALMKRYEAEGAGPMTADREKIEELGVELVERALVSDNVEFARHNSARLAAELMALYFQRRRSCAADEGQWLTEKYISDK